MGAGIFKRVATEGFFEAGKTVPRVVFRGVFGGNTPKIEFFEAFLLGVEHGGGHAGNGGGEVFILGDFGALHVKTGGLVFEKEQSGNNLAVFGFGARLDSVLGIFRNFRRIFGGMVVGEIEGGKGLNGFGFEIFGRKSANIFGFGELILEFDKIFDVLFGILGKFDRKTFFGGVFVAAAGGSGKIFDNLVFFWGEIKSPGAVRIEIVGFAAIWLFEEIGGDFWALRFNPDKNGVFTFC